MAQDRLKYNSKKGLLKNLSKDSSESVGLSDSIKEFRNGYKKFENSKNYYTNYFYQHRYLKIHFPLAQATKDYKSIKLSEVSRDSVLLLQTANSLGINVVKTANYYKIKCLQFYLLAKPFLILTSSIVWFLFKLIIG